MGKRCGCPDCNPGDYHCSNYAVKRMTEALDLITRLEDKYREAGLPYDIDTGAQMASRRAGDLAREGLGLPVRESAYDPPLGKGRANA